MECPKDRKDWYQTMMIYPRGLHESLTIDVQIICDCPCEKPGHPVNILYTKAEKLELDVMIKKSILFTYN